MKRPSRGERLSAATTRYDGCLVLPTRMRRSFTAMCVGLLVEAREPGRQLRHGGPAPALLLLAEALGAQATHPLHHPLHLLELLDEPVHLARRGAAAGGDAQPPAAVDDLGPAALLHRHRVDDRLDR